MDGNIENPSHIDYHLDFSQFEDDIETIRDMDFPCKEEDCDSLAGVYISCRRIHEFYCGKHYSDVTTEELVDWNLP